MATRDLTTHFVAIRSYYKTSYESNQDYLSVPMLDFGPLSSDISVVEFLDVNWQQEIKPIDSNLSRLEHDYLDKLIPLQNELELYLILGFYSSKDMDRLLCHDVCSVIASYINYWNTMFIPQLFQASYKCYITLFKEFAPKCGQRYNYYMENRQHTNHCIATWNGRQIEWNILRSRGSRFHSALYSILNVINTIVEDKSTFTHIHSDWRLFRLKQICDKSSKLTVNPDRVEILDRIDHYLEQNEINLREIPRNKDGGCTCPKSISRFESNMLGFIARYFSGQSDKLSAYTARDLRTARSSHRAELANLMYGVNL